MFAQVVLQKFTPPEGFFTYSIPETMTITPGMLVTVPYRNQHVVGIVTGLVDTCSYKTIKDIEKVLSVSYQLTEQQLSLAKDIADYYIAPLNTVIQLMLPRSLWEEHFRPLVSHQWQRTSAPYSPSPRATKEQQILELFAAYPAITSTTLAEEGMRPGDLKSLIEKNVVEKTSTSLSPSLPTHFAPKELSALNEEQTHAVQTILQSTKPTLLHGITGSGKTEVYLHIVQKMIRHHKQSIVLVPEISLTPQMLRKFQEIFGTAIAVIHSHLNPRERATEWLRIYQKEAMVVIGSRSALFSPLQSYGAIIIDEEGDYSYKNGETPRYHAHQAAEWLMKKTGAYLVYGSATPSVESYVAAQEERYTYVQLTQKYYSTTNSQPST